MSAAQSDSSVLGRIDSLVQEEERLYAKTQLGEEDGQRLSELKVELDQCWDLLRQRRALREFGRIRKQQRFAPPKSLETTSSSSLGSGRFVIRHFSQQGNFQQIRLLSPRPRG